MTTSMHLATDLAFYDLFIKILLQHNAKGVSNSFFLNIFLN